ncbi:ornithine cyclodeaminase family protein [Pseudaestuariivita atlantica]|uniref:Ornithine cyclodeaminase n=1 Tax=Pseudaestuariivita atlantica TaxID=1317121 RepID=A0A0L1JN85_9RHOB|nr:ornithine cyclodeaminase [Pseudaestuariivita atlantica]KNG93216.1 ornithine cyclodeaminase [Pseudaestuariivita atlantica]
MSLPFISFEDADPLLDWKALGAAFEAGHTRPKAEIADSFLYRDPDTLLNRAAWIDGLGLAVKSATVFPGRDPMINGAVSLFNDSSGAPEAILDFHLVTKWKTAGDSAWAASRLARPDSRNILIVGAGTVGRSLVAAYRAWFPGARFSVWNRTPETAERFARDLEIDVADALADAVARADIVSSATMTTEPLIDGDWLRPGTHVDLIGAYRPDMREANDAALLRARVFVDSFDTTLGHIGELKIPLEAGVIPREHVLADFYEGPFARGSDDEITLFKNGGGAHLDLMTSRYILDAWRAAR